MKARAPGKLVISGAYAVLSGAPAIVSAVDRYVTADSTSPAVLVTPEIAEAMARGALSTAPSFNADALRDAGRKLGLGSSAAILVASLVAGAESDLTDDLAKQRLFELACDIHRAAQGGGSGVDVAASVFGGTRVFVRGSPELPCSAAEHRAVALPQGLFVEVWASRAAASTSAFLSKVNEFARAEPTDHARIIEALSRASRKAVNACDADDAESFLAALDAQFQGFLELGNRAGIPICTAQVQALYHAARRHSAVVIPAGAGGGDVSLFVGHAPSSQELQTLLPRHEQARLEVKLGAAGVHELATELSPV